MYKSQHSDWTLECQSCFDKLHSQLANTPMAQLPDPNKPFLLFTDASKFCYSGIHTHASTKDSNEALIRILTRKNPLDSVASQTEDLRMDSNIMHPVLYIQSKPMQMAYNHETMFQCLYVYQKVFLLFTKE